MLGVDIWNYPKLIRDADASSETPEHEQEAGVDLTGFGVEALDGSIGKVDRASYEFGGSALVVDTGPWIFGTKVLIPAGIVDRIDTVEHTVYVHRSRDEIKGSPEYSERLFGDATYRGELGRYYGQGGVGYRNRDDHPPRLP